jgi:hypothetical protein
MKGLCYRFMVFQCELHGRFLGGRAKVDPCLFPLHGSPTVTPPQTTSQCETLNSIIRCTIFENYHGKTLIHHLAIVFTRVLHELTLLVQMRKLCPLIII